MTLGSVQYDHSVQYDLGLFHAGLGNGTPIGLTLSFRIHHEIQIYNVSHDTETTNGGGSGDVPEFKQSDTNREGIDSGLYGRIPR